MMKTFLALTGFLAAFAFVAPVAVADYERGHRDYGRRQVDTCDHCRRPVYAYRQCAGYDRYDRPIHRWVTVRHRGCARDARRHGYHDRHYDRGPRYHPGRRHPRFYAGRPGFRFGFRFGS